MLSAKGWDTKMNKPDLLSELFSLTEETGIEIWKLKSKDNGNTIYNGIHSTDLVSGGRIQGEKRGKLGKRVK